MRTTFAAIALCLAARASAVAARSPACDAVTAPPGAVYVFADEPTASSFAGNTFAIDGNDRRLDGGAGTMPAVFGIATRSEANAQAIRDSLSAAQRDNVTGRDYSAGPPIVPSIAATAGPSVSQVNQLCADLLALPGVVINPGGNINGNATFGVCYRSTTVPQITYFSANTTIKANGNASGCGIMIVDGDLTVQGTLSFTGLVIVRGSVTFAETSGITANGTVFGSLWTTSLVIGVASFVGQYSSEALALAGSVAAGACPAPVCGDGVVDPGEECDDGNTADGDCCSSTCTLEPDGSPCSDGTFCNGPETCTAGSCTAGAPVECDDGDACTTDACDEAAKACRHDPVGCPAPGTCLDAVCDPATGCGSAPSADGAPCDDGDACTADDACAGGACAGVPVACGPCMVCDVGRGCVAAPATGCRASLVPSGSRLVLRNEPEEQVSWTWPRGAATLAEFGDPVGRDDYTLCVFGGSDRSAVLLRAVARAGGTCAGRPCWTASGTRGYRYHDALAPAGLTRLRLTAGADGKAKIKLLGKGEHLDPPPLPTATPLTVQLRGSTDACWETFYPAENVTQDARRLLGRGGLP